MTKRRICLWSSPRNISTAMMYAFSQRPDTCVVDEPLYARYLEITGSDHPGIEEIIQSQSTDETILKEDMLLKDYEKPIVFFKQMTHHLLGMNMDFLDQVSHIIFIRNPRQIISSYAQVRPEVNMDDIGIAKQWELYNQIVNSGNLPVVLDSNEILKSPEKVLRKLCDTLEITYYPNMLSWPSGPKKEDGVWAKYWYANVHKSTGFEKQLSSERPLPEYLEPLYEESKKYYDQLFIHSIKAN